MLGNPLTLSAAVHVLGRYVAGERDIGLSSVRAAIGVILEDIDCRIESQLDLIFRHPDFMKLEAAWRGLHYLVETQKSHATVRIRVLNVSRAVLEADMSSGPPMATALWSLLICDAYQQHGGVPFGCVVADYFFNDQDGDVLGQLGRVCRSALAPVITGWLTTGAPASKRDHGPPFVFRVLAAPAASAAWDRFRASEDARFVTLTLPRILARDERGVGSDDRVWINAAYAMAANCGRSHEIYGRCYRIRGFESGGVLDFPGVNRTSDGPTPVAVISPLEYELVDDREEILLARQGLSVAFMNRGVACFISAETAHQVAERHRSEPETEGSHMLMSRLPFVLECSLWTRHLRLLLQATVKPAGRRVEARAATLNRWLSKYVDSGSGAPPAPLTSGMVVLEPTGNPEEPIRLTLAIRIPGLEVGPLSLQVDLPSAECGGIEWAPARP